MKVLAAVTALILAYTTSLCWSLESAASAQTMSSKKPKIEQSVKPAPNRAPAMLPQEIRPAPTPNRSPAIVGAPIVVDSMHGTKNSSTGAETAAAALSARAAMTLQVPDSL